MAEKRRLKLLKQYAETEKGFGVGEISREKWQVLSGKGTKGSASGAAAPVSTPKSAALAHTWEELQTVVAACRLCRLCEGRTNTVFGTGNPRAQLMFIGEAPGHDEDVQGKPFVGRAGQLLTKIIEAMGLKREDVFIANILKCRPPENRPPLPDESALCTPYLLRQIELIKPKVICALGKSAAQALLQSETPITKLRGVFHDFHGTKLMPTFHPAYLLRNPAEKKTVWEDMQKIMKFLGLKKPS